MRRLRWTAYLLVVLSFMLSFFHRMAPAAISGDLAQAFDASGASLGVLAASYFYVYTLMQVPTGVLVDTLGPRRIVALGGLVAAAGSIMFGLAPTLDVAVVGRAIAGLGVSVVFISLLKLNAAWFPDRQFGTMSGLTLLLGNVGSVLSATPLAWAVTITSWRNVFVAAGILSAVLAALTWAFVRNSPREAGFPSMRELEGKAAHAPHHGHWLDGLKTVLRNPMTWPGFWASMGSAGCFFSFAGLWAVPYLRDVHGMTPKQAALHTTVMLLGFACSSLAIGSLSDRIGKRRPVIIGGTVLFILCWIPLLVGMRLPWAGSLALFACIGMGASGFTVTWANAKEVNRPALSGMATSVVNTGGFLGAALLQPIVGWIMDVSMRARGAGAGGHALRALEDYRIGFGFMVACAVLGLVATFFIRETNCRYLIDQEEPRPDGQAKQPTSNEAERRRQLAKAAAG